MMTSVQRHEEFEMLAMARKLGVEEELKALRNHGDGDIYAKATGNCECCSSLGECHLFLDRAVGRSDGRRWWLKGFCPNAKLLLGLVEEREAQA